MRRRSFEKRRRRRRKWDRRPGGTPPSGTPGDGADSVTAPGEGVEPSEPEETALATSDDL